MHVIHVEKSEPAQLHNDLKKSKENTKSSNNGLSVCAAELCMRTICCDNAIRLNYLTKSFKTSKQVVKISKVKF